MAKLIYCGSSENSAFLKALEQRSKKHEFVFIDAPSRVSGLRDAIAPRDDSAHYVISVPDFVYDDAEEIASALRSCFDEPDMVYVLLPGYDRASYLSTSIKACGFNNFLFGLTQGSQIREIESYIPELKEPVAAPEPEAPDAAFDNTEETEEDPVVEPEEQEPAEDEAYALSDEDENAAHAVHAETEEDGFVDEEPVGQEEEPAEDDGLLFDEEDEEPAEDLGWIHAANEEQPQDGDNGLLFDGPEDFRDEDGALEEPVNDIPEEPAPMEDMPADDAPEEELFDEPVSEEPEVPAGRAEEMRRRRRRKKRRHHAPAAPEEEAAGDLSEYPAEDTVEEPGEDLAEEPAEELTEDPTEEELAEEFTEEPAENPEYPDDVLITDDYDDIEIAITEEPAETPEQYTYSEDDVPEDRAPEEDDDHLIWPDPDLAAPVSGSAPESATEKSGFTPESGFTPCPVPPAGYEPYLGQPAEPAAAPAAMPGTLAIAPGPEMLALIKQYMDSLAADNKFRNELIEELAESKRPRTSGLVVFTCIFAILALLTIIGLIVYRLYM